MRKQAARSMIPVDKFQVILRHGRSSGASELSSRASRDDLTVALHADSDGPIKTRLRGGANLGRYINGRQWGYPVTNIDPDF